MRDDCDIDDFRCTNCGAYVDPLTETWDCRGCGKHMCSSCYYEESVTNGESYCTDCLSHEENEENRNED